MTGYPGASGTNLVDILDRVLDKGLVVAGDIKISLANVELLTIKIRLLVCSIDKAEEIGLNWWRYDQSLVHRPEATGALPGSAPDNGVVSRLEARITQLERQLQQSSEPPAAARATPAATRPSRRSRPARSREPG